MIITKTCQYAIRALVFVLKEYEAKGKKVSIKEITTGIGTPAHFTAKILQTLSKRNMLASTKGPGGGFYAHPNTATVSILDIIYAFEGEEYCNQCLLGLPNCSEDQPCPAHFKFKASRQQMIDLFEGIQIRELANNIEQNEQLFTLHGTESH